MVKVGVTLIAIFMLILFSFSLLSSLTILLSKEEFLAYMSKEMNPYEVSKEEISDFLPVFIAIALLLSLLYLTSGIGLLTRKEWGRKLSIVVSGIHAFYGVFGSIMSPIFVLNAFFGFSVIYYLTRESVRREFVESMSIEERILGRRLE